MPRVTVGIPVYNGAASLARCLDAVFAQTFRDYEVLVLDDGSTDGSAEIAESYGCRVIRTPNAGAGAGRRRIVEEAAGDLIAWVDHDDFWRPEKLAHQVDVLDSSGADMVHADAWYVHEDGREIPRDLRISADARSFEHILPDNRVINSTAVFRRQAMLDAGNFVEDTLRCNDWYGWFILAPGRRFVHMPERLVRYSVLSTSLANAGYRFHAAQYHLLSRHILPREAELFRGLSSDVRARYRRMLRRAVGVALSSMAKHKRAEGDKVEARRLASRALRSSPDVLRVWTRALRILLP